MDANPSGAQYGSFEPWKAFFLCVGVLKSFWLGYFFFGGDERNMSFCGLARFFVCFCWVPFHGRLDSKLTLA